MVGAVYEPLVVTCMTTAAASVPDADAEPACIEAVSQPVRPATGNMAQALIGRIDVLAEADPGCGQSRAHPLRPR